MTYLYVDEDSVEQDLLCSQICYQPLVDPVTHNNCNNLFCYSCIKDEHWICPLCGSGTERDYTRVTIRALLNLLSKIKVQCNNCKKQMDRGDFEQHIPNCTVACPQGCGQQVPRSSLREHESQCLNAQVSCAAFDLGCTCLLPRGDVDAHVKTCRYELSRWIVEPLKKEIEEIKNKLAEECNNRKKDVEEITRQLQLIFTMQKTNTLQKQNEFIGTDVYENSYNVHMHSPVDEPSPEQDDSKIEYLASGSRYSGDIKIWNINDESTLKVLKGHTRAVLSLIILADNTLVSASEDKTIRFWNVETSTCTKALTDHKGEVTCIIELTTGEIASCSWDESIRIWRENGNTQIINTGRRMEHILQYSNDTLVCSSWDYEISFWKITNGQKIKSLKGHTRPVCSLIKLKDGKIASGSWDKTIRVWKDDTCVQTLEGHTNWVTTLLELSDGRLASGSSDTTVRVWNIDSGDCSILATETQSINALAQTKEMLLIGTCGIKVWKNGQCVKTLDKFNEVRSLVIKYNN